jgi:tetratricopeptide (TPR) repeat protein
MPTDSGSSPYREGVEPMNTHLTDEQVGRYCDRRMRVAELLAVDVHLAECAMCRGRLAEAMHLAEKVASLRGDLEAVDAEPNHLSFEQLAGYVDGSLEPTDCEIVDGHIEWCDLCRREVEDLAAFRAAMASRPRAELAPDLTPSRPPTLARIWRWPALPRPNRLQAAAALALLAVVAGVIGGTWWRMPMKLVRGSPEGAVLVNGERIGLLKRLGVNTDIVCIGPTWFRVKGIHILAQPGIGEDPRTVISIRQDGDGLQFGVQAGTVSFTDEAEHEPYQVVCGDHQVNPMGTRFQVTAMPGELTRVSVYESNVEVTGARATVALAAGWEKLPNGESGVITDDLTALAWNARVPVPQPNGSMVLVPRTYEPALPAADADEIARLETDAWRNTSEARPYVRIAIRLAELEERSAAAIAIRQALDRDPELAGTSDDDLLVLMRPQAVAAGDTEAAEKLLALLDSRGHAHPDYLLAWRRFLDAKTVEDPDERLSSIARAIKEIRQTGAPPNGLHADRLYLADSLINDVGLGKQALGYQLDALQEAVTELEEVVENPLPGAGERQIAVAYQRISEAQMRLGNKHKTVQPLREAIRRWPRPDWKVNLGTRICEADEFRADRRDEAFGLIREGLAADPSCANYERARVAVQLMAHTKEDWDRFVNLIVWIADTFPTVPDASLKAAQNLAAFGRGRAQTMAYIDRAVRLVGGVDQLSQSWQLERARMIWMVGDQREARALMAAMIRSGLDARLGWMFFDSIGDYRTALREFRGIPKDQWDSNCIATEARLLAEVGHVEESVSRYKDFIDDTDHWHENGLDWYTNGCIEARMRLAELLEDRDPKAARTYAQEVLDRLDLLWLGGIEETRHRKWLTARADWVLGRRVQAMDELHQYLNLAPWPDQQVAARKRLEEWKQKLSQPASDG